MKRAVFLIAELVLYGIILTAGGTLLVASEFLSIVLCFLYAISSGKQGSPLLMAGLGCTVAADFCLVICDPVQRLWGMVFFLAAQFLYAIRLHSAGKNNALMIIRVIVTAIAVAITVVVLGDNTDALAIISLCYYANLIMNIVAAYSRFSKDAFLFFALVLFILCDTVIGLQVASGSYFPIGENSFLYRLIFMDFNLAWFFYLPSQVLIAWTCAGQKIFRKERA